MPGIFTISPDGALTAPVEFDTLEAALRWQAHVDAGRIGKRRPARPDILANRARTEAILRRAAVARRAARARAGF